MRRNMVKQRLQNGETVIGTAAQLFSSPAIAQIFKQLGFDFLFIDTEHGAYNLETIAEIIRVARLVDLCPLVRVIEPSYPLIARTLDQGAMGIIIPRVETPEQVRTLVECAKYKPIGRRGSASDAAHSEYHFGPLPEFLKTINDDVLLTIMVESQEALDCVDDLFSVPGLDAVIIGPEDLSISLGVPGETNHPRVVRAIEKVIDSAQRHNIVPGHHIGTVEDGKMWMAKGVRLLTYSSDMVIMMDAAREAFAQLDASRRPRGNSSEHGTVR